VGLGWQSRYNKTKEEAGKFCTGIKGCKVGALFVFEILWRNKNRYVIGQ
jgi:hypothetical protein